MSDTEIIRVPEDDPRWKPSMKGKPRSKVKKMPVGWRYSAPSRPLNPGVTPALDTNAAMRRYAEHRRSRKP